MLVCKHCYYHIFGYTKTLAIKDMNKHIEKSHPERKGYKTIEISKTDYFLYLALKEKSDFWGVLRKRKLHQSIIKSDLKYIIKDNEQFKLDEKIGFVIHLDHYGKNSLIHTTRCPHYQQRYGRVQSNWLGPYATYPEIRLIAKVLHKTVGDCGHCIPRGLIPTYEKLSPDSKKVLIQDFVVRLHRYESQKN